ncbi:MAG TPA: Ig-like domain-containing protein [Mycobacteriales bacterium]|nr:Ig-like domain-containing protein [Mycobacteriales bacterium]
MRVRFGRYIVPPMIAGAVLVAGGVAAAVVVGSSHGSAAAAPTATKAPPPPVGVSVVGLRAGVVPWSHPLTVSVTNGRLVAVVATDPSGGVVNGSFDPSQSVWRGATTLIPLTHYSLTIAYANLAHQLARETATVTASDSGEHLDGTLTPGDGDVVGVGQPVALYLDRWVPEAERAAVQARLRVSTSPSVVGAWSWIDGQEVHWRPQHYWAPGTAVHVSENFADLYLGNGVWGRGIHSVSFRIGDSHVSIADINQHIMTVYDNGRVVNVFKISAGRDKYPTKQGVHIALEKEPSVQMISSTVGIPVNSPDGYDETVYWDVRISDGGEFVHAAPWSVAQQGHVNVSHGCINLAPANAQWFYYFSQRGDVVDVIDGGAPTDTGDPGMADWNMSWSSWLAGSA